MKYTAHTYYNNEIGESIFSNDSWTRLSNYMDIRGIENYVIIDNERGRIVYDSAFMTQRHDAR